jgi:hypothetical protein
VLSDDKESGEGGGDEFMLRLRKTVKMKETNPNRTLEVVRSHTLF